jgi:Uma2 family endonuclease
MEISTELQAVSQPVEMAAESEHWAPPPPPTDLIFDDGRPLESNRHRIAMNVLIRSVKHQLPRQDYFIGGNMFIYYSARQARNQDFRGPDFFVVLGVDPDPTRLGWVTWQEEGRFPDVIVEFLSASTAQVDKGIKKDLYERVFKTRDYFIYDPFESASLQGWHLDLDQGYQAIAPDDRGWLWCQSLELWAGVWTGDIQGDATAWLRFFDNDGNLVLLPEEDAEQRAAIAEQQAEIAQQQAEIARQRAETAEQRAERLAERLRELGVDPEPV